jgi:hypothetical protein
VSAAPVSVASLSLAEFKARYPQMQSVGTGGNCTALFLRLDSTRYVLITDGNASEPTDSADADDMIYVGVYDDRGTDSVGGTEPVEYNFLTYADAALVMDCWMAQGVQS